MASMPGFQVSFETNIACPQLQGREDQIFNGHEIVGRLDPKQCQTKSMYLSFFVTMYVCMHACMCVRVCKNVYACAPAKMYLYLFVCVFEYAHVSVCVYVCIHIYIFICMYVCNVCMYVCICLYCVNVHI